MCGVWCGVCVVCVCVCVVCVCVVCVCVCGVCVWCVCVCVSVTSVIQNAKRMRHITDLLSSVTCLAVQY